MCPVLKIEIIYIFMNNNCRLPIKYFKSLDFFYRFSQFYLLIRTLDFLFFLFFSKLYILFTRDFFNINFQYFGLLILLLYFRFEIRLILFNLFFLFLILFLKRKFHIQF
jgi:hypothetical protein